MAPKHIIALTAAVLKKCISAAAQSSVPLIITLARTINVEINLLWNIVLHFTQSNKMKIWDKDTLESGKSETLSPY